MKKVTIDPLEHIRAEYEYYGNQPVDPADLWDAGFLRGLQHAYEVGRNGGPRALPGRVFWTVEMRDGRAVAVAPAMQASSSALPDSGPTS